MGTRQLPDWIDAYLEYTENTEPRETFRRWVAISGIASALQRKVFLPWGDTEMFYPNMYIVLVGPPAAAKGTAMRPMTQFLNDIGIKMVGDETSRQYLVQTLLNNSINSTDLEEGIAYSHSSISAISSELTVFLGYQNFGLISVLCKLFDCESSFKYDTFVHGEIEVNNVWFNLLGATTPTSLQQSLPADAIGAGLTSRTIFVYEESNHKSVIWPSLTPHQKKLKELLLQDLSQINIQCGRYRLEKGVVEAYGEWRLIGEETPPFSDPKLSTYLQRRKVHIIKLMMIYSASRSDSKIITIKDFQRATQSLEEVEKKMPNVFRGVGTNPLGVVQIRIMDMLPRRKGIPYSELMTMFCDDINTQQLSMIITTLEQMGFAQFDVRNKVLVYKPRKGSEDGR